MTSSRRTPSRRRLFQYAVAGLVSAVLVGLAIRFPGHAGVEGPGGYLFLAVLVVYLFATASDRTRRSRYFLYLQAGFFLAWGGYNALRGRRGFLTVVLLVGGVATLVWERYGRATGREGVD